MKGAPLWVKLTAALAPIVVSPFVLTMGGYAPHGYIFGLIFGAFFGIVLAYGNGPRA